MMDKLLKVFADGADLEGIVDLCRNSFIKPDANATIRGAAYGGRHHWRL